jgi:hypothetical protein
MTTNGALDLQRWRVPPIYRMLSPGTLLSGEYKNKVWRAIAQIPGSTEPGTPMIVKWIEKKENLAAELACALAASALRLRVPTGVLVLAETDMLTGLPKRLTDISQGTVICFGSEFQWPDDTLAKPTDSDQVKDWVWSRLCETSQGSHGGVWDELLANEDRHTENVVFDGKAWWLIDHERSLTPVSSFMMKFAESAVRQAVVQHRAKGNPIASEMLSRHPNTHKMESIPQSLANLRSRLVWLIEQVQKWKTGNSDLDTLFMMTEIYLRSIDLRLPALPMHLHERLKQPATPDLWSQTSGEK